MDNAKNKNDEPQEPPRVSKETVELAVKLLLKMINSNPKDQKPQDPGGLISLVVTLKSGSDRTTTIPITSQYIPLPHPLYPIDGSQGTCLIIGDEKEGLNAELAENKIKEEGLPISKVFQFSKLRADYKPSKHSKKLSQSFDLFMVCKSVFSTVFEIYLPIRKHLIPVDLAHERWKGEIESASCLTFISIHSSSCVAEIGRVSQACKEIVENIVAGIDSLVSQIPEKWNNISSMHLNFLASLQFPLYQSFSEPELKSEIVEPRMNGKGEILSKKRTKRAEKTRDAKRKKDLASEGKTGSFNVLVVGDGGPKDDSPAASGVEKENESVDSQGGVVANSVKVTAKKEKSRRWKKSSVRDV